MPLRDIDALLERGKLAGMQASEARVMRAWLQLHSAEFDRIEFEVRLGQGGEHAPGMTPEEKARWTFLTRKRADAIVWLGDHALILETKPRLRVSDMGQLLGYRQLYALDNPGAPPAEMRAIAWSADPDVRTVFAGHGITIELLEIVGGA